MAHKLADETLAQIFALHFDVPDDVLNSSEPYSRFYEKQWASSSHVLVVCKRWMRVATPALYHIVILRSAAQAKALYSALKANKALGGFIRKIRVEGGFGASSEKVIAQAPNLTDIVLNMIIYGDDSTKGLCKILPKINPTSLGLTWVQEGYARSRPENANERNLRTTILQCLPRWSKLARLFAPASHLEHWSGDRGPEFRDAIAGARNLQELHLSLTSSFSVNYLQQLAGGAHVSLVALYNTDERRRWMTEDHVAEFIEKVTVSNADLASKLVHMNPKPPRETPARARLPAPSVTPNADVLHSSPVEIQHRIWTQILSTVMKKTCHWIGDMWYNSSDSEWEDPQSSLRLSRNIRYMLVCKTFLRIVQQQASRNLRFGSPAKLLQFVRITDREPELASHVETLSLTFPTRSQDEECQTALSTLLGRVSLRSFSTRYSLAPEQWGALATASGPSLKTLSIDLSVQDRREEAPGTVTLSASMFLAFVCLSSLRWNCNGPVVFEEVTTDLTSGLPCLSVVDIDHHEKRAEPLLSLLAGMQLPSLRALSVSCEKSEARSPAFRRFLGAHGDKLSRLRMSWKPIPDYLRLCPNITRLEIGFVGDREPWLKGSHEKLEHVEFDSTFDHRFGTPDCSWKAIFDHFDVSGFPALQEFRVSISHLKWPTEQRAVAKFPWTAWGEKLMEHNVKLVDRKAGQWRPRLQTAARGTRTKATR